MNHLLEFYGTECPHCVQMHELVERLEKEEGIKEENDNLESRIYEIEKEGNK